MGERIREHGWNQWAFLHLCKSSIRQRCFPARISHTCPKFHSPASPQGAQSRKNRNTSVNANWETVWKRSPEEILAGWFLTDNQNSVKRMLKACNFKYVWQRGSVCSLEFTAELQPCSCPFLSFVLAWLDKLLNFFESVFSFVTKWW